VGGRRDEVGRVRLRDELASTVDRYRVLVETTGTGYVILDEQGRVVDANPEYVRLSGHERLPEIVGRSVVEWTAPEEKAKNEAAVARCLENGLIRNFETAYVDKLGKQTFIEVNASVVGKDGARQILSLCRDVTVRKQAEDDLLRTLSVQEATLDSTADGILVVSTEGAVVSYNRVFLRIWRIPEALVAAKDDARLLSHVVDQLANPAAFIGKVRYLYSHPSESSFDTLKFKDGRTFERYSQPQRVKDTIVGRVWSFRDVSERRKLEDELQRRERLDSLGVLAGGIAHDFNNLLACIFGFIDIARSLNRDAQVDGHLQSALTGMERARALTHQLLTFAKGGEPVRTASRLFPFVKETVAFALSGTNLARSFDVPEDLWPSEYDQRQLEQAIDNIVINAHQAMPQGGIIKVTASNVVLTAGAHPVLPAGNYVRISIADQGVGIPPESLPRIFDPFFTTKEHGNGLGLATAYSILRRHDGVIDVESAPDQGAIFHLYLPAASHVAPEHEVPRPKRHVGTGVVLVMDDEALVRTIVSTMVRLMGYSVVEAQEGGEALRLFEAALRSGTPFKAVFLDLTVPGGMGGIEAAAAISQLDHQVPLVVLSGYADDPAMARPGDFGFSCSLRKPFAQEELVAVLESCLRHDGR
jgi:two-component system, cell cycle sensor histidine kinase and response regulator CckA